MKTRLCSVALAVAVLAICGFSRDAGAVGISIVSEDTTNLPAIGSLIYPSPISTTGNVLQGAIGSLANQYRSPFEDFSTQVIAAGYGATPYTSIGSPSGGGFASATYNFSSPQTMLAILWGSPDVYNTLTFYSGLNGTGALASFTGSNLAILTYGHDLVKFLATGETFLSIVLSSSSPAFEFVIDPVNTPLPAALPLFATGLGLVGYFARRRKQKLAQATMAAA